MREEEIFRLVMRNDLAAFAQRSIAELMPTLGLDWNWHHDLIADRLMQLADGRIQRLLICVPPRSLKSLLCSVIYPAWLLARDASKEVLCVSYSQSLADDFARKCRQLMETRFYSRATDTRLNRERRAVEQFQTTAGGVRLSSSVGGTVTGRGGGFIIIDDPMKPEEALSETGRKSTLEWLRNTLASRPDNKRDVRMLVIMQRLHEDDVAGHLMRQGDWEPVILPAIASKQEQHQYTVAGRPVTKTRAPNEALHPSREPLEVLERLRREMSNVTFSAQYLQDPLPVEGNLVRRSWFRRYKLADTISPERIIQSWDTASKLGEECDYSVCTTWALKRGIIYLLHVWRGKVEMPELCRQARELANRFNPERVLIEDKGSGIGMIQALRALQFHKVIPYQPRGDKLTRFVATLPGFEGGHIRLPESAPWLDEYEQEICGFPGTKHDDQVDSTSQAIAYLDTPQPGAGFIEFCRQELIDSGYDEYE